jgi:hypothetical protein
MGARDRDHLSIPARRRDRAGAVEPVRVPLQQRRHRDHDCIVDRVGAGNEPGDGVCVTADALVGSWRRRRRRSWNEPARER